MIDVVPWEEIDQQMLVQVPGCEWPMARLTLLEAAREFYAKSFAWIVNCSPIVTMAGVREYDMLDVSGVDVVRMEQTFVDGEPLEPVDRQTFTSLSTDQIASTGQPRYAVYRDGLVELWPVPQQTGQAILVSFAVKPERAASGLPRPQWDEHIDWILEGAVGRLLLSSKKPYSDPELGAMARRAFEDHIMVAAWKADTSDGTKVRRTTGWPA